MKAFVSHAVKATMVASLISAPLSANAIDGDYENDADFATVAASAEKTSAWSVNSDDTTGTATATAFEECQVEGVCRTYIVTGGGSDFSGVVTNNLTGETIYVAMGQEFQAPVLYVKDGQIAAGIEYTVTADVGPWVHFCYPQSQTLMFVPADQNKEIKINIPCE